MISEKNGIGEKNYAALETTTPQCTNDVLRNDNFKIWSDLLPSKGDCQSMQSHPSVGCHKCPGPVFFKI